MTLSLAWATECEILPLRKAKQNPTPTKKQWMNKEQKVRLVGMISHAWNSYAWEGQEFKVSLAYLYSKLEASLKYMRPWFRIFFITMYSFCIIIGFTIVFSYLYVICFDPIHPHYLLLPPLPLSASSHPVSFLLSLQGVAPMSLI